MISFVDLYKDRFSVESLCRVMGEHTIGGFLSPRGYRYAQSRPVCTRQLRDEELVHEIKRIHAENYGVYGVRKMWHAMQRSGWQVGRDQVGRLMKIAGVSGVRRGRSPLTTRPPAHPDSRPDLVQRNFRAARPNQLWVADITYVRTLSGFVYTAFVTDVYSRMIVGWATRSTIRTEALPLQALDQEISQARGNLASLIHHSDHGSQYVSIAYGALLADHGIRSSTGTVGDSYDNALAETVNGLYKTELIYSQSWAGLAEVEFATMNWVHWWNNERLHQALRHRTPKEVITAYNQTRAKIPAPI